MTIISTEITQRQRVKQEDLEKMVRNRDDLDIAQERNSRLTAAKNNAICTNYIKAKIDNTQVEVLW